MSENFIAREAAVRSHLLKRKTALRILTEVFARCLDGAAVVGGQGFIVVFDHDLENLPDRRDLIGTELLDQTMHALFELRRVSGQRFLTGSEYQSR